MTLYTKIINVWRYFMHSWPRVLLWTSNNGGSLEMTSSDPFMRKIVSMSVKTCFYLKITLDFDGPPVGLESLSPLSNIGLRYSMFLIHPNLFAFFWTLCEEDNLSWIYLPYSKFLGTFLGKRIQSKWDAFPFLSKQTLGSKKI